MELPNAAYTTGRLAGSAGGESILYSTETSVTFPQRLLLATTWVYQWNFLMQPIPQVGWRDLLVASPFYIPLRLL